MKYRFGIASQIWDILYPVLMYYVAITVGMFIAQMIFGAGNETYMLCKIIGSIFAIPVVFADYKHDQMLSGRWGLKTPVSTQKVLMVFSAMGIILCVSIALNNLILMSPLVDMSDEYENAANAFYGSSIWLELLGSALITPYLEELLHRGVVYGRLRRMMGAWPAIIVSSLIFGALHYNLIQFIYAFCIGIVLALFVEKTGKLYVAVFGHIVANTIAVIRTETGFLAGTVDGSAVAWVISIVLLVIGVIGMVIYCAETKKNEGK